MAWYLIVLIVLASLVGLFLTIFIIGKIARPKFKFKHEKKHTNVKASKVEQPKPIITNSNIGLNLEGKIPYADYFDDEPKEIDEPKIDVDKESLKAYNDKTKNKSLAQQIRELSPELKVLLFDRGLARKDYDFNSKKD